MRDINLPRSRISEIEAVKEQMMSFECSCRSERGVDALRRLACRVDALEAWAKLRAMPCVDEGVGFFWVVHLVGRETVGAFNASAATRYEKEICKASKRASKLAVELFDLIEKNEELQFFDYLLVPPIEEAALDRLRRGVTFSGGAFPDNVEAELDALQARDYPDYQRMSTRQAADALSGDHMHGNGFLHRLKQFAALAERSSLMPPRLPRPKSESARRQSYALSLCTTFDVHYGAPRIEIVTALTSAAFDEVIDSDTVKKWWQRRSNYWKARDTSDGF